MSAASAIPQLQAENLTRNARRSLLIMLAGIIGYDAYSWYLALTTQAWQLFIVAVVVRLFFRMSGGGALMLPRRSRSGLGLGLTVAAFLITDIVIGGLVSGLGV